MNIFIKRLFFHRVFEYLFVFYHHGSDFLSDENFEVVIVHDLHKSGI
jgi:hypothetical protein